ncbi:MAG: FGGY-family carbohydrate kinase [Spirochaetaceae bacterium]
MSCFLGIDIGTYSSKGVLVAADGSIVARHSVPHDLDIPRPGRAEHDAEGVWWHDFVSISNALLEKGDVPAGEVAAVGTSGIAPCVLPLSADGRPLRPAILYGIDTRATAEIEQLNRELGVEWIVEHSGCELSAQSAGPKILWIKHHEPEVWKEARHFVTSTSYLVYRLTGELAVDHYTAAFFGPLYDIEERGWSRDGCAPVCRPDQLAEPIWTTDVAGRVGANAAAETGLAEGTPVIAGTADAASEAVSAGVLEPGDTMVMYGSSVFIIRLFDTRPRGGVFWPAPSLVPGTFALAAGMSTTGAVTQWFREEFGAEERAAEEAGGENAYAALARRADEVPAGAEGLLALPYFSGERTPLNDPDARGVIAGLTLRHSRAHIYRAFLEGVAFGVRHNLEEMAASAEGDGAGGAANAVVAIGGGAANRPWMQIVADVLGRPHTVRSTPGASYGDAALAAVGAGGGSLGDIAAWVPPGETVEPTAARGVYERLFPLYRDLYRSSADTVHALAAFAREGGRR